MSNCVTYKCEQRTVNMRTILGAIGINEPSAQSSTLPLLSPSSSCSEASDSPDFREKVIEIGIIRIEYVVIQLMIGTPEIYFRDSVIKQ